MQINSLNIDTSDMPAAQTIRNFIVQGSIGAEFQIIILQNPSSSSTHTLYYDFNDRGFEPGYNDSSNSLKVVMNGNTYSNRINFPSGGGDYVIKLITVNGTTVLDSNSNIITKNITKAAANATVTFTPGTLAANAGHYATLPTSTSTGAVTSTNVVNFNWDVVNTTTNAKSHGFIIDAGLTINDSMWYVDVEKDVLSNPQGNGQDTLVVKVADVTGIVAGMELKFYKDTTTPELNDGSNAGVIRVLSINTGSKTITFNGNVGFDEGLTMTFRAYGTSYINASTGCLLDFNSLTKTFTALTSTLRDDSDGDGTPSTTVRLGRTRGIAGGAGVTYSGQDVDNSSTNTVTSVTADADGSGNNGAMVVTLTQTLKKGTVLRFLGSHEQVNLSGIININSYPSTNTTIYLDLEKIIELGTAS
tara:strand:+ start:416 stop:1666 length:1251 start_codon:yes stop_codon:yes gene_type:complete